MKNFQLEEAKKINLFGDIVMTIGVIISFMLGLFAIYDVSYANVYATIRFVFIAIIIAFILLSSSVILNICRIFAINAENVYVIRKTICKEEDSDDTENTEEKLSDEEIEAILEKENS